MSSDTPMISPERRALLRWITRFGAVSAEALAYRRATSLASARASLVAAVRGELVGRRRPLVGHPALYVLTRTGARASGVSGAEVCRVSAANALHLIACAGVASALERCYPEHRVLGERELRYEEREHGAALASSRIGAGPAGEELLHRPDLVLWPLDSRACLPTAIEVELTVKAPRRLTEICRSWARCREVEGVLYLVSPEAERAVVRAVDRADAGRKVVVVPLQALPGARRLGLGAIARTVAGDA